MAVINVGDGRFIEHHEGALRLPPPVVKKPKGDRGNIVGLAALQDSRAIEDANIYRHSKLPDLPGSRKLGVEAAKVVWEEAERRAKRDMENISKDVDIHDAAQEALTAVLVTMRAPINQPTKLAAARTVLEYTMAKPTAKSEVTVNAAEKWLAEISE
jgi:hypothetical protein